MVPHTLPDFLAAMWFIVYVCVFMVLPELIVYCVWRFLRDLRRIAVALEANARTADAGKTLVPVRRPAPGRSRQDSIVPSQFGF